MKIHLLAISMVCMLAAHAAAEQPKTAIFWANYVPRTGSTPFGVTPTMEVPGRYRVLCYDSPGKKFIVKSTLYTANVAIGIITWPPTGNYRSVTRKGNLTVILQPGAQALVQIEPPLGRPLVWCEMTWRAN